MPHEVSVVVPVRDNQRGIDRLLRTVEALELAPSELIIVDSASHVRVVARTGRVPVRVHRLEAPGAARARNVGWRAATCEWILFWDSDCVPTPSSIVGYADAWDGSIAYAGAVSPLQRNRLAAYYEAQRILVPPPDEAQRPAYLVTANALVARAALVAVDGFDERFSDAGGEDIDLAYRLQLHGTLCYAPGSQILHDFGDGWPGFVHRMVRYGTGNWLIEALHGSSHRPRPFAPARRRGTDWVAAIMQFLAMTYGYERARLGGLQAGREPASRRQ